MPRNFGSLTALRPRNPEGPVKLQDMGRQLKGIPREVVIPYTPREVFIPFHNRKQRFSVAVAHRRCGKTVAEINDAIRLLLTNKRIFPPPQAAFISPTYAQSKRNAWLYAKHYTSNIPGIQHREGDLTVVFPTGARYFFAGSDNYDSLRGIHLDHAGMDEYGDQDPRVWTTVIRPALSDYGGTASFIGSAKGLNHFYELLEDAQAKPEDWYTTILKASETGILSKAELDAARKEIPEEQYRQEYECDFHAAVSGTFYGKEISLAEDEKRIREVPHDREADTYAGWDLGLGKGGIVWVYQRVMNWWHFIDCYIGMTPDAGLTEAADWVKSRPYVINQHFLPHDAAARELMTTDGTTRYEFLTRRGLNCRVLPRRPVEDGINTVRVHFNKFVFDKNRCKQGIQGLRMYRTQWDEKNKVYSNIPHHDWASHMADALRMAVMGMPDINQSDWTKPLIRGIRGVV